MRLKTSLKHMKYVYLYVLLLFGNYCSAQHADSLPHSQFIILNNKLDSLLHYAKSKTDNIKSSPVVNKPNTDALKEKDIIIKRMKKDSIEFNTIVDRKKDSINNLINVIKNRNIEVSNLKIEIEKFNTDENIKSQEIKNLYNEQKKNLEAEIAALLYQDHHISEAILKSMNDRADMLKMKGHEPQNIKTLKDFIEAAKYINTAEQLIYEVYTTKVNISINALTNLNVQGYVKLNQRKAELLDLLKNYCKVTSDVIYFINLSEEAKTENIRIDYIDENAKPLAVNYPYLIQFCKSVRDSKVNNTLKSFTCN